MALSPSSRALLGSARSMLPILIDAGMVTPLPRAVISACDEMVEVPAHLAMARSNDVTIWRCLTGSAMDLAMDAVVRALPAAEFGRIKPV